MLYRIFWQCVVLRLEPTPKLWVSSPPQQSNSWLNSVLHALNKVNVWKILFLLSAVTGLHPHMFYSPQLLKYDSNYLKLKSCNVIKHFHKVEGVVRIFNLDPTEDEISWLLVPSMASPTMSGSYNSHHGTRYSMSSGLFSQTWPRCSKATEDIITVFPGWVTLAKCK